MTAASHSSFSVLGLMSGTSLDGLDMALCHFTQKENEWLYSIEEAITVPYDNQLKIRLENAIHLSAIDYVELDVDFARFCALQVNRFLATQKTKPILIASHGHTAFHQPERGITTQIGSGAIIAAHTGIDTVSDFRTTSVALHGQGAPLVPVGDKLLFSKFDACLNLGGFSNISYDIDNKRVGFDVCPCNMALNRLANDIGLPFDAFGNIAKTGIVNDKLFNDLALLDFYHHFGAKSLGKEWFDTQFFPIIDNCPISIPDKLRTVVAHIVCMVEKATQPLSCTTSSQRPAMLVTGGGANNSFLLDCMQKQLHSDIVKPQDEVVNYKEALIFAFMGLLRVLNKVNSLKEVTGSSRDCCGGALYLGM